LKRRGGREKAKEQNRQKGKANRSRRQSPGVKLTSKDEERADRAGEGVVRWEGSLAQKGNDCDGGKDFTHNGRKEIQGEKKNWRITRHYLGYEAWEGKGLQVLKEGKKAE